MASAAGHMSETSAKRLATDIAKLEKAPDGIVAFAESDDLRTVTASADALCSDCC